MSHKYRMFKKPFDCNIELDQPPIPMTGLQCLDSLHGLEFKYGKQPMKTVLKRKRGKGGKKKRKYSSPWKKKSILFDLPYWKDLLLRHNLDVMHIEKNVTESVIGTLLGMDGKDKDFLNARLDCKNLIYLLPLAIRYSLPREAKSVLLELSSFFRNICTKVGTKEHFQDLSRRIAITLCHLERYLHTLKKYVRNQNRPEGSIVAGYIIKVTLGFCALYFGDEVVTKRNRPGCNADSTGIGNQNGLSVFAGCGRSLGNKKLIHLDHTKWERAHRAVLFGCPEVAHYISQHEKLIIDNKGSRESTKAAQAQAHMEFPRWFSTHIQFKIDEGVEIPEDLEALARGPNHWTGRYLLYTINGISF
ncbi:hypothetical protein ACLB2K_006304 [Fragaria x ananassa]